MSREYIEERDGGLWITGTRVSLDSIVRAFLRGESPEGIVDSYPAVTLEQVFGALASYLADRDTIDSYLDRSLTDYARLRDEGRRANPSLYAKLEVARKADQPAA